MYFNVFSVEGKHEVGNVNFKCFENKARNANKTRSPHNNCQFFYIFIRHRPPLNKIGTLKYFPFCSNKIIRKKLHTCIFYFD